MNHQERLERAEAEASKYKVLVGPFVIGEIIKAYLGDDEAYVKCVNCDGEGWTEEPEPKNGGATSYQCQCECATGFVPLNTEEST